jgi:hypothetical protein
MVKPSWGWTVYFGLPFGVTLLVGTQSTFMIVLAFYIASADV